MYFAALDFLLGGGACTKGSLSNFRFNTQLKSPPTIIIPLASRANMYLSLKIFVWVVDIHDVKSPAVVR